MMKGMDTFSAFAPSIRTVVTPVSRRPTRVRHAPSRRPVLGAASRGLLRASSVLACGGKRKRDPALAIRALRSRPALVRKCILRAKAAWRLRFPPQSRVPRATPLGEFAPHRRPAKTAQSFPKVHAPSSHPL
jgi:hypothetical protein